MANYSQETIAQARAFDNAAAPEKMRVHALAKALGIQSKDVIRELDTAGVPDKRAQSAVSADERAKVIAAVTAGAQDSTDGDKKPAQKKTAKKAAKKPAKKTPAKAARTAAKKTTAPAEQVSQAPKAEETSTDTAAPEAAQATESTDEKSAEPKKAARKSAKQTTRRRSSGKQNVQQADQQSEPAGETKKAEQTAAPKKAESKKTEPKKTEPKVEQAADATAADQAAEEKAPEAKKAAPKRRRRVSARSAPKSEAPAAAKTEAPSEEDSRTEAQTEAEVLDAAGSEPRPPQVRTRRRTRRTVRRTTTSADGSTQSVQGSQELFSESNEDGSSSQSEAAEITETTVDAPIFQAPKSVENNRGSKNTRTDRTDRADRSDSEVIDVEPTDVTVTKDDRSESGDEENNRSQRSRRRRRGRGRGRSSENQQEATAEAETQEEPEAESAPAPKNPAKPEPKEQQSTVRDEQDVEGGEGDVVKQTAEPTAIKGSTRLEAQRRRRADRREQSKKRHVISEAEFLARRESVERTMVVRDRQRHDHSGTVTQVGVLEDDLLVEHMVTSETEESQIGNIYLGRVQNVLPSMEAAFIDIGHDRNGVLYSADVNWRALGPEGKSRRIERFLKSGDQVLVQVSKDPIGHKGPRLTTQISFAGRFLVYVPDGQSAGISRKLPEPERKRLKRILKEVTPEGAGTIVRTAAEGVEQEAIAGDIARLEKQWNDISTRAEEAKARKGAKPLALYEEPDLLLKVVRDIFNEDFSSLVVQGGDSWRTVKGYVDEVAPDLADRVHRYLPRDHGGTDVFDEYRIEEQIEKALDRKVWLPSGGSLIIDRTEAMTVIDVNTGKFTGSGGNLEETVTRNNLEAAEEIVRQMRLRDLGGMIVVDFIDMVLPENQDLVLRRVKEALGRDRTRHEVSEVTSLGLVQMTRKRLGTGLLETFSTECKTCRGTGYLIHEDPVEHEHELPRTKRSQRPHDKDDAPKKSEKKPLPDASRPHTPSTSTKDQSKDSQESEQKDSRDSRDNQESKDGQEQGQSQSKSSQRRRRRRANQRRAAEAEQQEQQEPSDGQVAPASTSGEVWSDDDDYFVTESSAQREEEERADEAALGVIDSIFVTASDKDDEALDPIAAVVAAATAEAAEKDPDEPSDDRYVSEVSRRRSRRRVVRQDQKPEQKRAPKQGSAKGPKAQQKQAPKAAEQKAPEKPEKTVEPIAEAAVKAVGSAETGAKGETYQEAVEKFEASPRRRRPTRGKSRSDHAPDPATFETEAPAKDEQKAEKPQQKSEQKSEAKAGTSSASSRRRRRVVRKNTPADAQGADEQQPEAQQTLAEAPVKKNEKVETGSSVSGAKGSSRGNSGGNRSSRSRRRVVRKNS
ncbi:translation initiation factor IF-2 N-terminal domain-containing protein [Corynebacterium sputi]|uniref:translation initiation factor IF-2 N-terminal domain-containing protein n=1 Tax=Corynebacterium sputi TaxID=489915 RepID=UPI0004290EF5|nr:translation initiation factor IF-2 N-terminal domain-containing protein [Corynebacterium sputi]